MVAPVGAVPPGADLNATATMSKASEAPCVTENDGVIGPATPCTSNSFMPPNPKSEDVSVNLLPAAMALIGDPPPSVLCPAERSIAPPRMRSPACVVVNAPHSTIGEAVVLLEHLPSSGAAKATLLYSSTAPCHSPTGAVNVTVI